MQDLTGDAHLVRVEADGGYAAPLAVSPIVHLSHGGKQVTSRQGSCAGDTQDPAAPLSLRLSVGRGEPLQERGPGPEDNLRLLQATTSS